MKIVFGRLLPHVLILAVLFFAVPLTFKLAVSDHDLLNVFILLIYVVNPVTVLVCGAVFGALHGFKLYYPLAAPLLFVLSLWIIYNTSALIYAAVYLALSLAGMLTGGVSRYIYLKIK